jgi:Uma2 family endonuclease
LADEIVIVPAPVIVVEVLSPSTASRDTGAKLADYFRVAGLRHYLIVRTDRPTVIHHRRGDADLIETRIVTAGALSRDPPGITLDLDRIYG